MLAHVNGRSLLRACLLSVVFFYMFAIPDPAAAISVTIGDGASTLSSSGGGFNLTLSSPAGQTHPMPLLSCTTRPCTVGFPSRVSPPLSTDRFEFRDNCKASSLDTSPLPVCSPTTQARVVKTDSSTDRIDLKGLQITARAGGVGRSIVVVFQSGANEFTTITSTSGSYPFAVTLAGTFTNRPPQTPATQGGAGGLTTSCPSPTSALTATQLASPCAQLTLKVNAVTANGLGSSGIATASVPCLNGSTTPCAAVGGLYNSTGSISTTDSASVTCGTTCTPVHAATLTAKFTAASQTLTLANSGIGAMSGLGVEDGGVEDLFYSLADELGGNIWISFRAGDELYRGVPLPPWTNETRHFTNNASIPISWEVQQGRLVGALGGVTLTSIATDAALPELERARNDSAYVAFIPEPRSLRWKDVAVLQLKYALTTSPPLSDSGDPRLGDLAFVDCPAATVGVFRIEVALRDKDDVTDVGRLVINLGNGGNLTANCGTLSNVNLVDEGGARVDPSFLSGSLASTNSMTVKQSQGKYGNLVVRSLTVVLDRGAGASNAADNYKVVLEQARVNESLATDTLVVVDPSSFVRVTDLARDGVTMLITRLSDNAEFLIPNSDIEIKGGKYVASVKVQTLGPGTGGTSYRVSLCLFGSTTDADNVPIHGRCIPTQGTLTLF